MRVVLKRAGIGGVLFKRITFKRGVIAGVRLKRIVFKRAMIIRILLVREALILRSEKWWRLGVQQYRNARINGKSFVKVNISCHAQTRSFVEEGSVYQFAQNTKLFGNLKLDWFCL
jgi:hypothetical protein